ncbi:MAG: hypothetical protein KAU20_07000 [Nanoarchaeota archaeon]|nr:hypothetical protein [Nanoarchaeota archaeon]
MRRNNDEIRINILKILRKKPVDSYFKLAGLVKTGFRTVKSNSEALQKYKQIEIEKIPKEKSPSKKESFRLSITDEGIRFLEKIKG